ncbi:sensor histidine kinase [Pedobacter antarcticus]|uniref:histidine kinase n=2 Tax=Pedobacter antarcticus TaxID=34086 RepID=A0A081PGE6_9SPHI|nr:HAMP domain-containing sensor histidine kinase [Pedobacter antarcticus]KEQ29769.1 histidine kinase [Pedobacter antarcticus 4BY]SDM48979.1 Histidine kinase-, DNA gyrase B-, and HSP90-like ATPase [Pedobacter antarcticus]SFE69161.1 Histidine kinase-, DNA gyrase B-, and HSP90-like ATPase [Pedobacter antarcticus]
MNPYEKKRRWKFFLLFFAIVIGTASVIYTDFFVKKMEREEKVSFQLYVKVTEQSLVMYDDERFNDVIETIMKNTKLPVIMTDGYGVINSYQGLDSTKTNYDVEKQDKKTYDPAYFERELHKMKEQHPGTPIIGLDGTIWHIYHKDSFILTQLRYFPFIQLGVIALFLLTAYVAFSSARRSEQDQVWVGMAKETAHQLGTPISSLMAWVELMKSRFDAEDDPLIAEMENDIKRLEVITDRFSKIGSKPVLEDHVVYTVISNFIQYFQLRTSDKVIFKITGDDQVRALLNVPLFDWVIENLLKNAANAIENEGSITINIIEHLAKEEVFIDVTDSGKGIPRSKFDTVFQPGYTTRKRGWGLGLSLTRRIVENYHSGQIYVKESELGKGTTFRIILKSSITYEPTST